MLTQNLRQHSCASPVLTAIGLINGNPSFSTPTESTSLHRSLKNLVRRDLAAASRIQWFDCRHQIDVIDVSGCHGGHGAGWQGFEPGASRLRESGMKEYQGARFAKVSQQYIVRKILCSVGRVHFLVAVKSWQHDVADCDPDGMGAMVASRVAAVRSGGTFVVVSVGGQSNQ